MQHHPTQQEQRINGPHHPQRTQHTPQSQIWSHHASISHNLFQQHIDEAFDRGSSNRGGMQGFWARKRGTLDEEDDLIAKKRSKGSGADSPGVFGWPNLLESVTSSPGYGSPNTNQAYLERYSTPQYDSATPPFEPTLFQVQATSNPVSPSPNREVGHVHDVEQRPALLGSMRPVPPAPPSPSESIREIGEQSSISSDHSSDCSSTNSSMDSRSYSNRWGPIEHKPLTRTRLGSIEVKEGYTHASGIEKRDSSGRGVFVMGFRPGCERCQRREKGHFAHYE
ncbi:hypothetical protein BX616_004246 [Lobosporangium transversale]|uniref:Uncharacterized protein n=1 Tax=Lobosporangium transversale TaxID=64571 RepID=A0A1Y2GQP1_9FUNG|nr:hypothetical protein BCR41DRAFT_396912 [Lobosporangium transversale]KAF9916248.1 hypothetical protein BX616_004246 [Lobosporangium transversale]ORZ14435.1 hypothetical protein BCR41DRAFT_396912 [Lobosporangium transversale]|eukprot:XP_021880913.1 hypothetical protein BCR41DRAFT_396912 [Lobosporangium transversale]